MPFHWKKHSEIWKGEGIYHLTFVVAGRRPLLGELVSEKPDVTRPFYKNVTKEVPAINAQGELAMIRLSPFGKAVSADLNALGERYEGAITICKKIVMDDHLHVVLWVHREIGKSVLQVAQGFRQGITHLAQDMGLWPKHPEDAVCQNRYVNIIGACDAPFPNPLPYHILEPPFIRTLSGSGQLQAMINYVKLNPYRKWIKRMYPNLFTMRKDTVVRGLRFRSMGNLWLLDWPERQMIECSRSESPADWQTKLQQALFRSEQGAITYTAAISRGEQYIARKIRESGWPLVILLKDGFPQEGSEGERFFKPGGLYFDTCASGHLLLLEPYPETYHQALVVAHTESALQQKAARQNRPYSPIPHSSDRWRFMAGNEIAKLLCTPDSP